MSAATVSTHRPTEPICPPWCAGHRGGYQGWEDMQPGLLRDHAEEGTQVRNALVMCVQRENQDHSLEPSVVALYLDGTDVTDLTPTEARMLAVELILAAAKTEARG